MSNKKRIIPRRKQNSVIIGTSDDTWNQVPISLKIKMKYQLIARDGSICNSKNLFGCGKTKRESDLEIDHVISISMGGPVCDITNMQLLCKKCHDVKTINYDNRLIEDRVSVRKTGRYV